MKQAENNEIDTLLRNLARRERTAAPGSAPGESAARGAHLDTDELSSYAERALPPSARARCTAHLADCDDCRRIVAQLTMAAGPLVGEQKIEPAGVAGSTWIQKISTFFSPRLIRYATPALVLIVVVFAFFGWRQQQTRESHGYIALNDRAANAPAAQTLSAPPPDRDRSNKADSAPGGTKSVGEKEAKAQPSATAVVSTKSESESDEKKAGGEVGGNTAPAKAGKPDSAPAADKAATDQPVYAQEPSPPAPAKQQSQVAANQEPQQQQKDLAKNNADNMDRGRDVNVQRKGPARNDSDIASQTQRGGPAKREERPATKAKGGETASAGRVASADDAETRTVFGRQFRRSGNAWVDTGYTSSMAIRSVTRGTDAYSALIADEPVIGGIAKQLSGEVIVVWKGRAYRIN